MSNTKEWRTDVIRKTLLVLFVALLTTACLSGPSERTVDVCNRLDTLLAIPDEDGFVSIAAAQMVLGDLQFISEDAANTPLSEPFTEYLAAVARQQEMAEYRNEAIKACLDQGVEMAAEVKET